MRRRTTNHVSVSHHELDGIDEEEQRTEGRPEEAADAENWEAAAAAGLDRGAYHFFTLCTPGEAQARHFLSAVPGGADALPPAVDLELAGNCSDRPDDADVQRELATFLRIVEEATRETVVLYMVMTFERRYPVREQLERPLWHRRILRRPDVDGWVIWQVMGHAHVDGIDGDVDLNVMRAARIGGRG